MPRKKDPNGVGEYGAYPDGCLKCGEPLNDYQRYFCSRECRKGFPRGETVGPKISKSLEGFKHTEESKQKIKENNARYWLGKKGPTNGRHHTEEAKQKLSEAHTGKVLSEEHKRKLSEAKRGEKHPRWKGGISFEPYSPEFNRNLKDFIRERDGWTCQHCGKTQREAGRKLDVHHIDYDKKNCLPENLVAVCNACNLRANVRRDEWIIFYRQKMIERGLCQ